MYCNFHRFFALVVRVYVDRQPLPVSNGLCTQAQQSVYETIDSGEVDTSDKLMRRLASVQGPPKTFLRVFADVRVFTLCCLLFFLVTMPALGAGPTAVISALFAVSCRLLL